MQRTSRSVREKQRADRLLVGILALLLIAAGSVVWYLQPPRTDRPTVTVFKAADCECCRRWAGHLRAQGFPVQIGEEGQWAAVRTRFNLPADSHGCHTALVAGLLVEGHVPAADVDWLLAHHEREKLVGLVVSGMPAGSPGMESATPQGYTVFGLDASGQLRPLFRHGFPGERR